jgi:hypothetical protein
MGLSLYYNWKTRTDAAAARRLIAKLHALALKLPFDDVSEIHEQDPPDGRHVFEPYRESFHYGDLYLTRKRGDGENEGVHVPALHAVFFVVRVEGAESASIGFASHPPVVLHHEDVIERDEHGIPTHFRGHGQGNPIEFPTRRRGCYSWQGFCKTQYAGNPKLGGEANFLRAHLSLIELLDQIGAAGIKVTTRDDSGYAKHRDLDHLLQTLRDWDAMIANFAGKLSDLLKDRAGPIVAPIKDRPDFEHLEAKGIDVLKKLAAKQRRRKKGS